MTGDATVYLQWIVLELGFIIFLMLCVIAHMRPR